MQIKFEPHINVISALKNKICANIFIEGDLEDACFCEVGYHELPDQLTLAEEMIWKDGALEISMNTQELLEQ